MRLEYERNLLRLQREEIRLLATLRWCLAVGGATVALHNLGVSGTSPHQQLLHSGPVHAFPDAPVTKFVRNMKGGKKGLLVHSRSWSARVVSSPTVVSSAVASRSSVV